MKKFYKVILAAALACCVAFSLAACGGDPAPSNSGGSSGEGQSSASLSRYDYVADMQGNTVNMTIAQNLKSVKIEITSMNLDLTAYCTVEGNVLTLTELADGNEQFYKGLSSTPYTLNEDGTAVPVSSEGKEDDAGLSRYDYVADMQGNTVNMTIAQNLKSVKIEITSMNLDLTAYCTVEGNVLTLTELADGNEQFYQGLASTPYVLNEDGTATPQS